MKTLLVLAAAGGAFSASGDILTAEFNPLGITVETLSSDLAPAANRTTDGYFLAPGIGSTAAGFALAGTGIVDSTFDGAAEAIGTSINGGILGSSDTTFTGDVSAAGNAVFSISVFDNDGAELFPNGLTVGGIPADRIALFLGANAGGNALDLTMPATINEVLMFGFDAAGAAVFVIDVTANAGGVGSAWTGSTGIGLGAVSTGLGIVEIGFQYDVTIVPAPASAALLGLGGLAAVRRRR